MHADIIQENNLTDTK